MKHTIAVVIVTGLLAGCAANTAPAPAPEPAPAPMPYAAPAAAHPPGTHGMRSLQRALAAKGYYHGRVDGRNGPQTKAAVARYQQDLGVTPTGEADDQTWSSLDLSEGN